MTRTFIDDNNRNQPADAASWGVGNKRISVRETEHNRLSSKRDSAVVIFVNNKPLFTIIFAGGDQGADKQYVNFARNYKAEDVKLVCDPAANPHKSPETAD